MSESAESVVVLGTGAVLAGRRTVWGGVCIESGLGVAADALSVAGTALVVWVESETEAGSWTGFEAAFGLGFCSVFEIQVGQGIWTGTDPDRTLGSWPGFGDGAAAGAGAAV